MILIDESGNEFIEKFVLELGLSGQNEEKTGTIAVYPRVEPSKQGRFIEMIRSGVQKHLAKLHLRADIRLKLVDEHEGLTQSFRAELSVSELPNISA